MRVYNLVLAGILLLVSSPMAVLGEGSWYHYYFKERIPLVEEGTSLAIFDKAGGSRQETVDFLAQAGYPGSHVREHPLRAWSVVYPLQSASSTPSISLADDTIARLIHHDRSRRFFYSHVLSERDGRPLIVGQDVLLQFRPEVSRRAMLEVLRDEGAETMRMTGFGGMKNAYRLSTNYRSGAEVLGLANRLAQRREVVFADPDVIFSGTSTGEPNDPKFPDCWHLHHTGQYGGPPDIDIDAVEAWDITAGDESIKIVVLDVGVQQDHPDLNLAPGKDFTSDEDSLGDGGPVNECDNHGTPMAGVISAFINNFLGVVGVAPEAKVASARTFIAKSACNNDWEGLAGPTVAALDWAQEIGAKVTNNSNDYSFTSSAIAAKYQETYDNGMVHFASAGKGDNIGFPAEIPVVNAVAGINWNGEKLLSSPTGPEVDFAAPGARICAADRTGADGYGPMTDYFKGAGTSYASSIAAGVAALLFGLDEDLSPPEVEELMAASAVDIGAPGRDDEFGQGLVNAHGALLLYVEVFADGFETGDDAAWSSAAP